MKELKLCPFCGGEAEIVHCRIEYEDACFIRCTQCEASMGLMKAEWGYLPSGIFEQEVIDSWNRRLGS